MTEQWWTNSDGRRTAHLRVDGSADSACRNVRGPVDWTPADADTPRCGACLRGSADFTTAQIGRYGVTYRQLDHWTRRGYIAPEGDPTPGSGSARSWPPAELAVVARMTRLVSAGLTPAAAARAARGEPLAAGVTVVLDEAGSVAS